MKALTLTHWNLLLASLERHLLVFLWTQTSNCFLLPPLQHLYSFRLILLGLLYLVSLSFGCLLFLRHRYQVSNIIHIMVTKHKCMTLTLSLRNCCEGGRLFGALTLLAVGWDSLVVGTTSSSSLDLIGSTTKALLITSTEARLFYLILFCGSPLWTYLCQTEWSWDWLCLSWKSQALAWVLALSEVL